MWLPNDPMEGEHVVLEPLSDAHIGDLQTAVRDGEAWKLWYASVPSPETMADYVKAAIEEAEAGNIAYAVRAKGTGQIVGTTRYYGVDASNRRALIGYTWYANAVRRTPVNTECKWLLLGNLFENHNAVAVEFRTHFLNQASRKAIERLGAKLDGILRSHQITRDGSLRDTAVYSIIASEWPAVRMNLLSRLLE